MKLLVITNGDGPDTREALELADNVASDGFEVEKIDWESDDAAALASLYDLYNPPAFVLVGDDGREVEKWQGENLPLASDIKHLM